MKKGLFKIGFMVIALSFVFTGLAHATGVDTNLFTWNPAKANIAGPGGATSKTWPVDFSTNGMYARNVYWNFNTTPSSPFSPNSNPDAVYYGSKDTALKGSDFFQKTVDVSYYTDRIGVTTANQSGTAYFSFNASTLKDSSSMLYVWAQIEVETTGNSYVSFSNLTGTGSTNKGIEISDSNGSVLSKSAGYQMTNGIYYAWFKVQDPNNTEVLTLNFSSHNGNGGTAYVKNLHVGMTPEPVATVLFLTGSAIMALKRRRKAQAAGLAIA